MGLRRKTSVNSIGKQSPRPLSSPISAQASAAKSSAKTSQITTAEAVVEFFLTAPAPASADNESNGTVGGTKDKVEQAKRELGNLECEVISALFPTHGSPESIESIAIRLGMSPQEVRDLADSALRGLRGSKTSSPRPSSVWN